MKKENVLVIHKDKILDFFRENLLPTQGLINLCDSSGILDFIDNNKMFCPREEMECNPEYKQIIPYILIVNGERVLLTQRTEKQSENRLHNKFSIGIGGHINENDMRETSNVVITGMQRELKEEINIHESQEPIFCGVINDDNDEVGKHHLAIVFLVDSKDDVSIKEKEKMIGKWVHQNKILLYYDRMESWSKILAESIVYLLKLCNLRGNA